MLLLMSMILPLIKNWSLCLYSAQDAVLKGAQNITWKMSMYVSMILLAIWAKPEIALPLEHFMG